MKNMTMKLMFATAVVALATGVASAQALKAEIPFAFRAGGAMMTPGNYTVQFTEGNTHLVVVRNAETSKSALLLPGPETSPSKDAKAKGDPVLTFSCGPGRCALIGIWTGGDRALTFPTHGAGKGETVAMIRLVSLSTR